MLLILFVCAKMILLGIRHGKLNSVGVNLFSFEENFIAYNSELALNLPI